jgi:hypothetical protein
MHAMYRFSRVAGEKRAAEERLSQLTNSQSAASKSESQLKEKMLQLQEQLQTKVCTCTLRHVSKIRRDTINAKYGGIQSVQVHVFVENLRAKICIMV